MDFDFEDIKVLNLTTNDANKVKTLKDKLENLQLPKYVVKH